MAGVIKKDTSVNAVENYSPTNIEFLRPIQVLIFEIVKKYDTDFLVGFT